MVIVNIIICIDIAIKNIQCLEQRKHKRVNLTLSIQNK